MYLRAVRTYKSVVMYSCISEQSLYVRAFRAFKSVVQPVIYDVVTVNNCYLRHFPDVDLFMLTHSLHSYVIRFTSVLCQHQSSGICFNYVLSDKNGRPLILSDKNRGNVDSTCHQPVIYDVVTVNNCYI